MLRAGVVPVAWHGGAVPAARFGLVPVTKFMLRSLFQVTAFAKARTPRLGSGRALGELLRSRAQGRRGRGFMLGWLGCGPGIERSPCKHVSKALAKHRFPQDLSTR